MQPRVIGVPLNKFGKKNLKYFRGKTNELPLITQTKEADKTGHLEK